MRDEPRGELARYAYGFSDKKPGWLFWAIHAGMVIAVLWFFFSGSASAHCYSIWRYPRPQHCGAARVWYVQIAPIPAKPRPATSQELDANDAVKQHHDEINALIKLLHGESE